MSGFSAEWLGLREPADAAARNRELIACVLDWRQRQGALTVLDLASGTGANSRFLAPLLGGEQHWRLVDHDPALLAWSQQAMPSWANQTEQCRLEWLNIDLVRDWERLDFQGAQLVTASALLDLVAADWLQALARRCGQVQAAVYIVLSYAGDIAWQPARVGDEALREWVNRHQRTDKGFGPALGPDAVATLATLLQQQGYRVKIRPSPWRLSSEQAAMQIALLDGWIEAALEIAPEAAGELAFWLKQRRHWIECGQSRLQIGHWDLWAWLD
jgi:SAM-dependent methyltransferase